MVKLHARSDEKLFVRLLFISVVYEIMSKSSYVRHWMFVDVWDFEILIF